MDKILKHTKFSLRVVHGQTCEDDESHSSNLNYVVFQENLNVIIEAELCDDEGIVNTFDWKLQIQNLFSLIIISIPSENLDTSQIHAPSISSEFSRSRYSPHKRWVDQINGKLICIHNAVILNEPYQMLKEEMVSLRSQNKCTLLFLNNDSSEEFTEAHSPPGFCLIQAIMWHKVVNVLHEQTNNLFEAFSNPFSDYSPIDEGSTLYVIKSSLKLSLPPKLFFDQKSAGDTYFFSVEINNSLSDTISIRNMHITDDIKVSSSSSPSNNVRLNEKMSCMYKYSLQNPNFPNSLESGDVYSYAILIEPQDHILNYNFDNLSFSLKLYWSICDRNIETSYNLDKIIKTRYPGLIIMAKVSKPHVNVGEPFHVTYSVINNLQDLINLKLVWNPQKYLVDPKFESNSLHHKVVEKLSNSVVCHEPSINLGASNVGTTVTTDIQFTALETGVYELGQSMKLNLQYSIGQTSSGHQRKGSITSTHSMPNSLLQNNHASKKTTSMSPFPNEYKIHRRTGSATSKLTYTTNNTATEINSISEKSHVANISSQAASQQSLNNRPCKLTARSITSDQVLKKSCFILVTYN